MSKDKKAPPPGYPDTPPDEKNTAQHLNETPSAPDGNGGHTKIGEFTISPYMTAEEKAAAIRLANEADPGPPLLSWRYFKFLITAFLVILNSGDNGM